MKHSKLLLFLLAIVAFSCTKDLDEKLETSEMEQQTEIIPKAEIDQLILNSLKANDEFNWNSVSDQVVWSALVQSDSVLTIGYQPEGFDGISKRISSLNIQAPDWKEAREMVYQESLNTLSQLRNKAVTKEELQHFSHDVLPFVKIKVWDIEVIKNLREAGYVRYVEPLGYQVDFITLNPNERQTSDSGCSNEPNWSLPSSDYSVISPNAKMSWNYSQMGISQAWNYSTGNGITVGLVDTGISPNQNKLNSQFNDGYSSGRYVERYGFYATGMWWWKEIDGPDDQCGHGTAMAGVIAAPRGDDGSSVGVAYNANLIGVRGTSDVVINGGNETDGVTDALVYLGNRSDVRIISMSIGDVFSHGNVEDAVRYAYGKGKLIFAAAGTSTNFTSWYGVIFPATMSETVAITGVKEGSGYSRCDVCHDGNKVDFTVIMERSGTNTHPLTTSMSGDQPATVGGSSVATATAAGIAALVWSRYPSWSRDQVLARLKQTADIYPNRSSSFGWGTLDAYAAVQ